jgi:Flp pilus assembly protein TadG
MRRSIRLLRRNRRGSAAVEMALVMPFLLAIMFGSAELGNYFMNEHKLVKAVRDGARFAARRPFSDYPTCSTVTVGLRDDTRNVVMNGYLSGGTTLTPNIQASNITVSTSCALTAGGQTMLGIYRNRTNGAQIVTVSATVNYWPIIASFGFRGLGMTLNASSEAAVGGI